MTKEWTRIVIREPGGSKKPWKPECTVQLLEQLNPKHPLLALAQKLPWALFEKEFARFYASVGRPAKPVRLMVGLLLLKQIENLSDGRVVEVWVQNPHHQAFCGMEHFQWDLPSGESKQWPMPS